VDDHLKKSLSAPGDRVSAHLDGAMNPTHAAVCNLDEATLCTLPPTPEEISQMAVLYPSVPL